MVALNPKALEQADALDAERRAGRVRGPLHGIPIVLKDNYATADMPTTAGSLALAGFRRGRDAFMVKKLRDAGAVPSPARPISRARVRHHHDQLRRWTDAQSLRSDAQPWRLERWNRGSGCREFCRRGNGHRYLRIDQKSLVGEQPVGTPGHDRFVEPGRDRPARP
jgi:hypothetical protein